LQQPITWFNGLKESKESKLMAQMQVLMVDIDGKLPNLALMKLSSFHKKQGDQVHLMRLTRYWRKKFGKPLNMQINPKTLRVQKAYISCIFRKNRPYTLAIKTFLEAFGVEVEMGGVGVDLKKELPQEVEHQMPDYSLYPNIDYSLGYTSRGCIRKCSWCVVWRKEGWIRPHSDLKEFLHPRHRKVILLDNNLLASPNWEKTLLDLIRERVKVCFTQGLDIRLINDDNAKLLRLCRSYDIDFTRPRLYFSFDLPEMEEQVVKGVEILKKHEIPPQRLLFYMLVGYGVKKEEYTWDYFIKNDYRRFEIIRNLGALPYPMIYNDRKDIPLLRRFQRWVIHHQYNKIPFDKYTYKRGKN